MYHITQNFGGQNIGGLAALYSKIARIKVFGGLVANRPRFSTAKVLCYTVCTCHPVCTYVTQCVFIISEKSIYCTDLNLAVVYQKIVKIANDHLIANVQYKLVGLPQGFESKNFSWFSRLPSKPQNLNIVTACALNNNHAPMQ